MVSGKSVPGARPPRAQVGEVVLHLRQVHSAVVVAVAALRQQNCELDEDIANLLQRSVADRIHDQIERLEGVARVLSRVIRRR
ncbi:MAG TPA: hypothetical protein VMT29_19215 [Steroidobacteraceae bacterium]|nr:hypothetical protein [Steroidobacteraceae bacterium]